MHYKIENNEYHLYINNKFILNAGKEISISYTYSNKKNEKMAVIYKHGSFDNVNKLHKEFVKKMNDFNISQNQILFNIEDQYMVSGKIDIDELNKIISICDYIGKFHEREIIKNQKENKVH